MEIKVERLPKKTLAIKVKVPKDEVEKARSEVVEAAVKEVEVAGFRRGTAPREVAEKKLDQGKVRGEVLNRLITKAYTQTVTEHHIKPVSDPRVEVESFEEELAFTAKVAEAPGIKLGNYKEEIAKLKSQKGSAALVGPDGQPLKSEEPQDQEKITLTQVLATLLKTVEVEMSDLLVEAEVEKMLARLIDQTAKLGTTVEEYLNSQKKTAEGLREGYRKAAEELLKTEFTLWQIAKEEGVKVAENEIAEMIKAAPDDKTKQELETPAGRTYIESVLVKNKTLEYLLKLTE